MDASPLYFYARYQNEPYQVCKMGIALNYPYIRIMKINPITFELVSPIVITRVHFKDITVIPKSEIPISSHLK